MRPLFAVKSKIKLKSELLLINAIISVCSNRLVSTEMTSLHPLFRCLCSPDGVCFVNVSLKVIEGANLGLGVLLELQRVYNTGFTTVLNYSRLLISTSLTPYKSTIKYYNLYFERTNHENQRIRY